MRNSGVLACQRRIIKFCLNSLSVLCLVEAWGQPADLVGFSQWLREVYPNWREEDAGTVVQGIAVALEDNSGSLSPEDRRILIEAGMANVQDVFAADQRTVPADFALFAETYRIGVDAFVHREPLSDDEQSKLDAQVEEIYRYSAELLAESSAANSESAATMLETGKDRLESSMHDPLSSSLKQPFSEEEMQAIKEGMDEAAEDFATGEASRGFPGGVVPAGLDEMLAETFSGRLLEPIAEIDDERSLQISEEMRDLLQEQADQHGIILEDEMNAAISKRHEQIQRDSEASARELSRLREAQAAMAPSVPEVQRAESQVLAESPPPPAIPLENLPRPQSPSQDSSSPPWILIASMLGVGLVAVAGVWGYRHRVR